MQSRSISSRFRLVGLAPYIILISSMIGLSVSTAWIYMNNDAQRTEMYQSVRIGSWGAYQAQIEYLELVHQATECLMDHGCASGSLLLQAQIFASRLDVLATSREYDGLEYLTAYKPQLQGLYSQLTEIFGDYPDDFVPGDQSTNRVLAERISRPLDEAGTVLRGLLEDTTLYNGAIERREKSLKDTSPTLPFLLLTVSGLAIVTMMMVEIRHRGRLLRELQSMRGNEQRQRENVVRLLDTLPAPVFVIDRNGGLTYENAAAVNMLGERIGGNIATLAAESGHAQAGEITTRRLSLYTADGRPHSFKCHLLQIGWSDEMAVVWVLNDAPVDGNAQLLTLAVGKMAILGELSSAIAHELNQPLATIKAAAGNAQILLHRAEPSERVAGKLVRITDQVDRMSRIVSNIRALAAPATPATVFDLDGTVNASIDVVGHQYMLASIRLSVTGFSVFPNMISGDATLLELTLLNILLNARDAFVSRGEKPGIDRAVDMHIVRGNGEVTIDISDNAGGIDPAILPTIFDSFVTSKAKSGGMGLGLAISRRCIEQMGGQISAANGADGAKFTIRLPLAVS